MGKRRGGLRKREEQGGQGDDRGVGGKGAKNDQVVKGSGERNSGTRAKGDGGGRIGRCDAEGKMSSVRGKRGRGGSGTRKSLK